MDEEIGQSATEPEFESTETGEETEIELEAQDGEESPKADEVVEVEYEGKKYQVPPELKDSLLRQSDYSRKTAELAEQRRAFEAERQNMQAMAHVQQENMQLVAVKTALEAQIEQFQNVDWGRFSEEDPVRAQSAYFQLSGLKERLNGVSEQLRQNESAAQQRQQETLAKAIEENRAILQRDIKGWNDELYNKLQKYGMELGYSQQEVNHAIDARAWKTLHKAYLYDQMLAKAQSKASKEAKPVTTVSGKAGGQIGLTSKMPIDEWMKKRNAQVRKQA